MGGIGGAISGVQGVLLLVLAVASIGVQVWAFLDALRHKPESYVAADKRTKNFWLLVTGIALAVGIVILHPLNFLNLIAVIAAAVYLADVRPALRQVSGRGGSSAGGPYGGW